MHETLRSTIARRHASHVPDLAAFTLPLSLRDSSMLDPPTIESLRKFSNFSHGIIARGEATPPQRPLTAPVQILAESDESIVAIETDDYTRLPFLYFDHVTRTTIVQIVRSSNYAALFIN